MGLRSLFTNAQTPQINQPLHALTPRECRPTPRRLNGAYLPHTPPFLSPLLPPPSPPPHPSYFSPSFLPSLYLPATFLTSRLPYHSPTLSPLSPSHLTFLPDFLLLSSLPHTSFPSSLTQFLTSPPFVLHILPHLFIPPVPLPSGPPPTSSNLLLHLLRLPHILSHTFFSTSSSSFTASASLLVSYTYLLFFIPILFLPISLLSSIFFLYLHFSSINFLHSLFSFIPFSFSSLSPVFPRSLFLFCLFLLFSSFPSFLFLPSS